MQPSDPSLARFLANNTPAKRTNKLEEFKEQIFFLKEKGFSDNQIVEFLRTEKKIQTTQQAVNRFIHTRKNSTLTQKKSEITKKVVEKQKISGNLKQRSARKTTTEVFRIDDTPLEDLI